MTRITLSHPTNPQITKQLTRDQAQRFLNGGWTVVTNDTEDIAAGDTDNAPEGEEE